MALRRVTQSQKGRDRRIHGLYGPSFGFLPLAEIVEDIRIGRHRYYVRQRPHNSKIRIVQNGDESVLESTRNPLFPSQLLNLPDFFEAG